MPLRERDVAKRLNLSMKKLQTWRAEGEGPYWVDLGNQGRNQNTASQPIRRKPIIRYPLDGSNGIERFERGEAVGPEQDGAVAV